MRERFAFKWTNLNKSLSQITTPSELKRKKKTRSIWVLNDENLCFLDGRLPKQWNKPLFPFAWLYWIYAYFSIVQFIFDAKM